MKNADNDVFAIFWTFTQGNKIPIRGSEKQQNEEKGRETDGIVEKMCTMIAANGSVESFKRWPHLVVYAPRLGNASESVTLGPA